MPGGAATGAVLPFLSELRPARPGPLALGADIVAHSLTKSLGGHSDVVVGALVTDDATLDERFGFYQNSVVATPDPFACFPVLRGT